MTAVVGPVGYFWYSFSYFSQISLNTDSLELQKLLGICITSFAILLKYTDESIDYSSLDKLCSFLIFCQLKLADM